ncbi:energy transducer TonB [Hymenobacter latericus]|uniref:energy transducer TonB n=1 Tax=Hymenobacter sp. YIM 151858-1 TaxID=2987688 RepID=UPI0022273E7D|nr:energy transducer TonB [Hymenobacter sp. YIM 151858-1]UYZ59300.1 energy transducer TonB [Hymenobacter sp. YIM 151858-1]
MSRYLLFLVAWLPGLALAQSPAEQNVKTKFERGRLVNGRPKGEWQYFDVDGKLDLGIDYDSGRITYVRPDSAVHMLRLADEWVLARPSRPPHLLGSHDRYATAICRELRYPIIALRTQTQGTVRLAFTVTRTGEVTDAQIEATPSRELAQEVLRALATQQDTWLPAVHQDRAHDARLFILVHFQYQNAFNAPKKNHVDLAHTGITTSTPVTARADEAQQPGRFLELVVQNVR